MAVRMATQERELADKRRSDDRERRAETLRQSLTAYLDHVKLQLDVRAFNAAFGRPMTTNNLGLALASYVRSILSGNSRVDRFTNGETGALTGEEREARGPRGRRRPLHRDRPARRPRRLQDAHAPRGRPARAVYA